MQAGSWRKGCRKPLGAVVVRGRTGRGEDDAALGVERHAGPAILGAAAAPGIRRPSLIAQLAGCGMVWKDQRNRPVRTSNARISPDAEGRISGSRPPMITRFRYTTPGVVSAITPESNFHLSFPVALR